MFTKSPLPESHGSLSKNVHIDKHFHLLQRITVDMPTALVRTLPGVDDGIYTTALKRYLLVDGSLVRRDKLINLVHEEGALTDRVRMVMYLLFMLRDARCRSFMCNNVAQSNGLWSDAPLQLENAYYPEFEHAGTTKAYTNLRGFLFQVGLIDGLFRLKKFPDLSTWFSDAVEIASQHIPNFETRQAFLDSPQAVLADCGALGLLNLNVQEILAFQAERSSDEDLDHLPIYEAMTEGRPFDSSAIKIWNRSAPIKSSKLTRKAILANPALLERAHSQHFLLERLTAVLCRQEGLTVHETILIDILARRDDKSILFEMKSCSNTSLRSQVRRGISQLLEYSFLYRKEVKSPDLCLVLERKPQGAGKWLIDYVESLEISLLWKDERTDTLSCSKITQQRLMPLLPQIKDWVT